ncbi:MAG: phosphate signaling complex protein PhoU [Deltaproteobacteria bacterium]|nr:phosphate signaling complex protein PhoU [Candidatus Tharpella sp.]
MTRHLQMELDNLKKELLHIASMVENATEKALVALIERRGELAQEVIDEDDLIDDKEVRIEEECLKILALYQPVANDLRFVITVLKVNNDIERVGDLAVNIAERAIYLSSREMLDVSLDLPEMISNVMAMLRGSLDALTKKDTDLARRIITMDDDVDEANREIYKVLQHLMSKNPDTIKRAVHLLSASRHLERIADLATNICEDVVYMVEGEVIRHQAAIFMD